MAQDAIPMGLLDDMYWLPDGEDARSMVAVGPVANAEAFMKKRWRRSAA
jgi:hypothetical protein